MRAAGREKASLPESRCSPIPQQPHPEPSAPPASKAGPAHVSMHGRMDPLNPFGKSACRAGFDPDCSADTAFPQRQTARIMKYDLLICNGRAVDPSQGLNDPEGHRPAGRQDRRTGEEPGRAGSPRKRQCPGAPGDSRPHRLSRARLFRSLTLRNRSRSQLPGAGGHHGSGCRLGRRSHLGRFPAATSSKSAPPGSLPCSTSRR